MKKLYKITFEIEENDRKVIDYLIENADIFEVEEVKKTRTAQQNRALHLYFRLLSEILNEKHIDMRTLIRQEIPIEWTEYSVKQYLWKPLQIAMFGKKSTAKLLKTKEIDKVYDLLNKTIIERTKGEVDVPFPSIDNFRGNYT